MSFDLYRDEVDNRIASLPGATKPEPGLFAGTGTVAMQTFAKAGSAFDLVGAVGPIVQDKFFSKPGTTEAQDRYFKEHDEVFGRAVDYWTPKPHEVSASGQIVGQLLATLPMIVASPAATVAATQLSSAEDLLKKGVDAGKAQAVGAVQAAGLGLGIWVPILGKTLAQRVLAGGAGFNAFQGITTRGISGEILEGTTAAGDFKAFDPTALTLDVLLGAAFGGLAHAVPSMRTEGDAWHKRMAEWGAKLKPSEVDALVALRQAQHLNADSMPGKPADMATATAHVDRIRQAIDDLANDRPVQVEDMPAGRFEADPVRQGEAEATVKVFQDEAVKTAEAEGTRGQEIRTGMEAPRPDEPVLPGPAQPEGDVLLQPDAPERQLDPLAAEAARFATENPGLRIEIGRDANGEAITVSPREWMEGAEADLAGAHEDARLLQVAAACLLGAA